jgi:hypothetical protein
MEGVACVIVNPKVVVAMFPSESVAVMVTVWVGIGPLVGV